MTTDAATAADSMPTLFPLPVQMPPSSIDRYGPAVVRKGKRPRSREPLVFEAAAASLLGRAMRWLRQAGDTQSGTKEVLRDLMRAARCPDGFAAAKELEANRGWSGVDAELVAILNDLVHEVERCHDALIAVWTGVFAVTPEFAPGDRVVFRVGRSRRLLEGEIVDVDVGHARYHVCCATSGLRTVRQAVTGLVLDYEQVLAPTPVAIARAS